jgi:hypothetical protein
MGNAATQLPYEIGTTQEYEGNKHWQLNNGTKKVREKRQANACVYVCNPVVKWC